MSGLSVRQVFPEEQRYFEQYLLPQTAKEIRRPGTPYTLLGALSGTLACGAAAVRWAGTEAELTSLFLDPLVRGRGLGGALVDLAVQQAKERGAAFLTCGYVLDGADLTAMNALFTRRGGAPFYECPAYRVDVSGYAEAPFTGAALRSGYRPAAAVTAFSQLTRQQLDRLDARVDIPGWMLWSACASRCDPELSLAWMQEEQVTAYLLGGESADGGCVLNAAWRGAEAPASSFPALLRGVLNRCWYQFGGGFPCYFSAVSTTVQALAGTLVRGSCREYAQMYARIPL